MQSQQRERFLSFPVKRFNVSIFVENVISCIGKLELVIDHLASSAASLSLSLWLLPPSIIDSLKTRFNVVSNPDGLIYINNSISFSVAQIPPALSLALASLPGTASV